MKEKYSTVTFAYMDKVGKLDEIENRNKVFNSFVTCPFGNLPGNCPWIICLLSWCFRWETGII
jgi:hypothetical protein